MKSFKAFIKPFEPKKWENKNLTYFFLVVWDWDGKGLSLELMGTCYLGWVLFHTCFLPLFSIFSGKSINLSGCGGASLEVNPN